MLTKCFVLKCFWYFMFVYIVISTCKCLLYIVYCDINDQFVCSKKMHFDLYIVLYWMCCIPWNVFTVHVPTYFWMYLYTLICELRTGSYYDVLIIWIHLYHNFWQGTVYWDILGLGIFGKNHHIKSYFIFHTVINLWLWFEGLLLILASPILEISDN